MHSQEADYSTLIETSWSLEGRLSETEGAAQLREELAAFLDSVASTGSHSPDAFSRDRLQGLLARWAGLLRQPELVQRWGPEAVHIPPLASYDGPPTTRSLRRIEGDLVVIEPRDLRSVLDHEGRVTGLLVKGREHESERRYDLELDFADELKIVSCRFVGCSFSRPLRTPGDDPPLDKARFVFTTFTDCSFRQLSTIELTASECQFYGNDYTEAQFSAGKFWGSIFDGGTFGNSGFERSKFGDCVLKGLRLGTLDAFSEANFEHSAFRDCHADTTSFVGARFDHAAFRDATFDHCDMTGARFDSSSFLNVRFPGAILSGASFNNTNVKNVKYEAATLFGTDFHQATAVKNADFEESNWRDAMLTKEVRAALEDKYPPSGVLDMSSKRGNAGGTQR